MGQSYLSPSIMGINNTAGIMYSSQYKDQYIYMCQYFDRILITAE